MPTYSSHPIVLQYTAPTSRYRGAICNHFGFSQIFFKPLASCHLGTSSLGVPSLTRLSTYFHRRLTTGSLCSSASHRTLHATLLHLADHCPAVNDACFLFIIDFSVDFWAYSSSPRSSTTISLKPLRMIHLCSHTSYDTATTSAFSVLHL